MSFSRLSVVAAGALIGLLAGVPFGIATLYLYIDVVGRFFECTSYACQWSGTMLAFFAPPLICTIGTGWLGWLWSRPDDSV